MGRTISVLAALLLVAVSASAVSARDGREAIDADDLTVLRAHNADAHLLALWRLSTADGDVSNAVPALADALGDPDWRVRWLAARAIGRAAGSAPADITSGLPGAFYAPDKVPVVNRLWDLLSDPEPEVRRAAAIALNACAPAMYELKTHSSFFDGLGDEDTVTSRSLTGLAVEWLQRPPRLRETERAQQLENEIHTRIRRIFVQGLATYYGHPPEYDQAKDVLWRIGDDRLMPAIEELQEEAGRVANRHRAAYRIIAEAPEVAAPFLIELLETSEGDTREAALRMLVSTGAAAEPALPLAIDVLESDDRGAHYWAVRLIQAQGPAAGDSGARALMLFAGDATLDRAIREALLELGPVAAPVAAPFYCERLVHRYYDEWRTQAVEVLSTVGNGDDYTREFIAALWADPDFKKEHPLDVWLATIEVLGGVADLQGRDVPLLLEIFRGSPRYGTREHPAPTRLAVAQALRSIGAGCAGYAPEVTELVDGERIDDETREHLLMTLAACCLDSEQARAAVAAHLSDEWLADKTREQLLESLAAASLTWEDVRQTALEHAGCAQLAAWQPELMKDPEFAEAALPAIIERLNQEESYAKPLVWKLLPAILALEDHPDELAPLLAGHISDTYNAIWPTIDAIIAIEPDSVQVFTAMLHSADSGDRYNGVRALGRLGSPAALPAIPDLLAVVTDQEEIISRRYQCAGALALIGLGDNADPSEMIRLVKRVYGLNPRPIAERENYEHRGMGRKERKVNSELREIDGFAETLERLIVSIGEPAVPALIDAAKGGFNDGLVGMGSFSGYANPEYDRRLRRRALVMLGEVGPPAEAAAPLLLEKLTTLSDSAYYGFGSYIDPEHDKKRLAAVALGKLGVATDDVVTALLDAARGEDMDVRAAAVNALRRLAGGDYSPAEE